MYPDLAIKPCPWESPVRDSGSNRMRMPPEWRCWPARKSHTHAKKSLT